MDRSVSAKSRLTNATGFDKLPRGLKQREILLVISALGTIDLHPFPCSGKTSRPKRNYVVSGELQFSHHRSGQAQSDAVFTETGKHLVADKVGVKAINFSCAHAFKFEKQCIDLRLAIGLACVSSQS